MIPNPLAGAGVSEQTASAETRTSLNHTRPDQNKRPSRVVIDRVMPEIDGGRFPIKRVVGDQVKVAAHVFTDGHDMLSVWLLSRDPGSQSWLRTPMEALGNDEWEGAFTVSKLGTRLYTVSAQLDRFGSWRRDTLIKISFGQDVRVDLEVGAALFKACAGTFTGDDAERLLEAAEALTACADAASINRLVDDQRLVELLAQWTDEDSMVTYERHLRVSVDPELAAFGAWYEMFPRSAAAEEGRHGSLNDVVGHLDRVARMGFDILYLPPIHPVGASYRKGKNNALTPKATDVGSPWAIGSSAGGHKAIHPQLGTIDDFDRLVKEADRRGLAIALDIAFQCSPDHPYVAERPDWFKRRSDGSIQYAENPPKKYQDIYPFDFECEQWRDLWEELKSVFEHWIGHGVRVFRVDNPHTKSFAFWEWVIPELKDAHPEVVFLAEAFTRPKVMYRLAKLGFSQSYTYFAWRNEKHEIEEYLNELTNTEVAEYFRPNLWPNTPDILHERLQTGGKPAFMARLTLAATLSASYGVYGPAFELMERVPLAHGSEEYLNSEKYEIRHWDFNRLEDNLSGLIARLNTVRKANRALHRNASLVFHETDNPEIVAYSKRDSEGSNTVLTVVNLDPHYNQSGCVTLDIAAIGADSGSPYQVEDLMSDEWYIWDGARNYVELDPHKFPANVFRVHPQVHTA